MYGWRARIGHIHPSTGTVDYVEFHRAAPEGVIFHTTCVLNDWTLPTAERYGRMEEQVEWAARVVASARVDLIVLAGTAIVFHRGPGSDRELCARIEDATGIPTTTMATSLVEAARALGLKRIAVGSHHPDDMSLKLRSWLEAEGFTVAGIRGLGCRTALEAGAQPPTEAYRVAREAHREAPNVDGIVIGSGNLRTFEIIETLERDTGRPVVTSNQATLWHALRLVGVGDHLSGYGRLLAEH